MDSSCEPRLEYLFKHWEAVMSEFSFKLFKKDWIITDAKVGFKRELTKRSRSGSELESTPRQRPFTQLDQNISAIGQNYV